MVSSPWRDSFPCSSEERSPVMDPVDRSDLLSQIDDLRVKDQRSQDRISRMRASEVHHLQRIAQLEAELEASKHYLQELNLLDGFLRSGAVRAINLENEPALKELLTNFLSRALQTALDTGAVQFSSPKRSSE